MAKKPMSDARRGRIRNIAEGAGVGGTMGLMTSGDPLHAAINAGIGAVVGAGAGVGMNIQQHRALQKKQFNKGQK
jgi:hypothetical protein